MFTLFPAVVTADGKDGNGLKLEKVGATFLSFDATQQTNQNILWVGLF